MRILLPLSALLLLFLFPGCTTIPPTVHDSAMPQLSRPEFVRVRELEDRVLDLYEKREESLTEERRLKKELEQAETEGNRDRQISLNQDLDLNDFLVTYRFAAMKAAIAELEAEKARLIVEHGDYGNPPDLQTLQEIRDSLSNDARIAKDRYERALKARKIDGEKTPASEKQEENR